MRSLSDAGGGRPDFLVIGSQKAGTTTVHRVLRRHPQVWVPPGKDLDFFFDDRRFAAGPARYFAQLADAPAGAVRGEVSPGYLVHPRAPARIARLLPGVKLVAIVREPIARALSQYWDSRRWLAVDRPFEAFCAPPLPTIWRPGAPGFISRGVYAPYIERYRRLFDPGQLLVLRFEQLRSAPDAFWRALFGFLGVDPAFTCPEMSAPHNPRSVFDNPIYRAAFAHPALSHALPPGARRLLRRGGRAPFAPPPLDPAVRAALVRFYAPWNARLEALLGVELDWPKAEGEA